MTDKFVPDGEVDAAIDAAIERLKNARIAEIRSSAESLARATPELLDAAGVCRKCRILMLPGKALQSMLGGVGDFHDGDNVVTLSPTGEARLIDCLKCPACGWSVTK